MILTDLLGWWYSRGWRWILGYVFVEKSGAIADFFSIGDLAKTLFAPFRQDAHNVQGAPAGVKLQAFGENLISRFFGLLIRSALIVVGGMLLLLNLLLGVVMAVVWPLLPVSPVVALLLMVVGAGQ